MNHLQQMADFLGMFAGPRPRENQGESMMIPAIFLNFFLASILTFGVSFSDSASAEEPDFDPKLTAAGNAAKNDFTSTALRWEALHRGASKIEQDKFLQRLGQAIRDGMADAPYIYAPISPCFERTYQSADLARFVEEKIGRLPKVDSRSSNPDVMYIEAGMLTIRRDLEQKRCDALFK